LKRVRRKTSDPKRPRTMIKGKIPVEFSISKARKAQKCIAQRVITQDKLPKNIRLIAGVDAAYFGNFAIGAVAVLDYDSFEVLETQVVTQNVEFPYIPTLLSFRELPIAVSCIRKLSIQPDVFLVDGHGRAHPFRCGLASHLGVVLGKPTIGVAKNKLIGEPKQVGEDMFLFQDNEIIGAVVNSRIGSKPFYVSIGHKMKLETAVKIVKHCTLQSRIPEPIRVAHKIASEERKAKIAASTTMGEK
jgi:deoxyribonuclease V